MVITPGTGHPTPFETAATLAIASVTIGLALGISLREARSGGRVRPPFPAHPGEHGMTESTASLSRSDADGFVREHVWTIALSFTMTCWSVVLFGIVRSAFLNFRIGRFDLGNMVQAVWSTTQGRPLEITEGSTGEQAVRLGAHVDPLLVLLAPLWIVWPSPLMLAFVQITVVALGALPVFWIGRRHLGSERLAGVLAFAYLAYPWVATSAAGAIHPVTFAITFLLFAVWFLDSDRLVPFGICAVLAMSTGELMGLPILGLGLWYALARRRRPAGFVIALAGLGWSLVAVYAVVGHFRGGSSAFYGFYDQIGGSPQGVVRMLFSNPSVVLGALFEGHDIVYVILLGVPLLFLFVLSPALAAVAIPQLLANGLSDFRSMTDPRYHSVAAVIPFLIAATVLGIERLPAVRRPLATGRVLACCLTLTVVLGPWARLVGETPLGGNEVVPPDRAAALAAAVSLVPSGSPVTASNTAGGHLSARRYVYSVPRLGRAEWVVVDRADPWVVAHDSPNLTNHPERVKALVARLEADPAWDSVFDRSGVVVMRRIEP